MSPNERYFQINILRTILMHLLLNKHSYEAPLLKTEIFPSNFSVSVVVN